MDLFKSFLMAAPGGGGTPVFTPMADNTTSLGTSSFRFSQIFVGQSGLKIGDGTNGPTITATGTSPNESFTIQGAGSGTLTLSAGTTGPAILAGNGAAGVKLQDSNNGGVYWAFSTSSGGFYPSNEYPLGSSGNQISRVHRGIVVTKGYTVSNLPSAVTYPYSFAIVTDSNSTTARATVAGGGSNKVAVFSDGTNWLIAA